MGTCKFRATCRFHHPRDKSRIAGRVASNVLGYPLCATEIECTYYMRNGLCKFGSICKFHHPLPSNMMVSLRGSTLYYPVHSPTTGQLSFPGSSFVPGPRWQSPSSFAPMFMHQGIVSVPGWNTYSGQTDNVFPERPGQSERQFYMKTGGCKFSAACRFHHPIERLIPVPDCVLSPIGLPLRPISQVESLS